MNVNICGTIFLMSIPKYCHILNYYWKHTLNYYEISKNWHMGISLEILFGSENGFACKRKPHAENGVYYISFKNALLESSDVFVYSQVKPMLLL